MFLFLTHGYPRVAALTGDCLSYLITSVHFPKANDPMCSDYLWGLGSISFINVAILTPLSLSI